MCKRFYILLLMIVVSLGTMISVSAQDSTLYRPQVPDNDQILKDVLNGMSPYYYPVLFMRYMEGDTTLTLEDYRHLYYGYAWQPEYEPFDKPQVKEDLLRLVAMTKDSLSLENAEKIIDLATEVMKYDPFCPGNLNILVYGYGAIGNKVQEKINYRRLQMVIKTIQSSGTVLKEASPWHVLSFTHATDMMAYLNLDYGTRRVVSRTTEYIPLAFRLPGGVKGYYFNFERMYWRRPEKMPEKESAGWEFNGIPLKKRTQKIKW